MDNKDNKTQRVAKIKQLLKMKSEINVWKIVWGNSGNEATKIVVKKLMEHPKLFEFNELEDLFKTTL